MNKLNFDQIKKLQDILNKNPLITKIVQHISNENGKAYLVGGAVRDLLLNLPIKDLDIEIHNLQPQKLQSILSTFGLVSLVGKSFGVYKLNKVDADWSLPRTDSSGRKPIVEVNPYMSIEKAFARRDLTINAMGIDLINFQLIDPFNGFDDLKNKILRATDLNFFIEDPLRFYRVMQFIGRFEMKPDKQLNEICSSMDIKGVSVERIDQEFSKMFLKSKRPSLGIRWLLYINRLQEVMPDLFKTTAVKQSSIWHPEGNVFEHTMQSLDAAANLDYTNNDQKIILSWAAICHDLGKIISTKIIDDKIISYGHEIQSANLAKKLLNKLTKNKNIILTVSKLCRYHMMPGQFIRQNVKDYSYKKLALKLTPDANLCMLSKLFYADRAGRNAKSHEPIKGKIKECQQFNTKIKKLNIEYSPEKPLLMGRDIQMFVKAGPQMGQILKHAYDTQIKYNIKDKEKLKLKILKKLVK